MKNIKRIISCVIAAAVILSVAFVSQISVFAAGGSLGGTSTVRAGDTISVTLSVSGPNVYGCSATFSYDSSVLTFSGHKQNISWGNFAFEKSSLTVTANDTTQSKPITNSGSIITLTFKVANNLPVGTTVSVKASGSISVLTDGNFKSSGFGATYSKKIASPLSANARLSSLNVSNATISPAFNPDTNVYTCSVPFTTQSLSIDAKAQDSAAKVSVTNNSLKAGATTNVTVSVKAPSGAVNNYTIKTTRAQDPNYVPDSNSALSNLVVDGYSISPVFSPEVKEYVVWLPNEIESIEVYTETASQKSSVTVSENKSSLVEGDNLINIVVKAEDDTTTEYKILAVRNKAFVSYEEYLNSKDVVSEEHVNAEQIPTDTESQKDPVQQMPTWMFAVICFFCLVAGFFGCLMIPRKKQVAEEENDFDEADDSIEIEEKQSDGFGIDDIFKE